MVLLQVWFFQNQEVSIRWIVTHIGELLWLPVAFVSGTASPAHLNPAVTFGDGLKGTLLLGFYSISQPTCRSWWWLRDFGLLYSKPVLWGRRKCRQYPSNLQYWTSKSRTQYPTCHETLETFVLFDNLLPLALWPSSSGLGPLQWTFDCRYRSFTRWDNGPCLEPSSWPGLSHHAIAFFRFLK